MPITRRIPVAAIGVIQPGSTHIFSFGPATKGIAYNRDGVIKAYVNRCTHMGGPVELHSGGTFRCRWHGADFDPCNGAAIAGEAPAGTFLKPVDIIEDNGILYAVLELPDDPFA